MTVHARTAFQHTLDDVVDVALRNSNRLAATRAMVRNIALIGSVLVGAAAAGFTKMRVPDDLPLALGIGVFAGVLFAMFFLWRHPSHQRRATRRALLEHCGPGPFASAVELHDDAMVWQDQWQDTRAEVRVPWSNVREVRTEGDDWVIEATNGIAVLRGHAFATAGEAATFHAALERLLQAANTRPGDRDVRAHHS